MLRSTYSKEKILTKFLNKRSFFHFSIKYLLSFLTMYQSFEFLSIVNFIYCIFSSHFLIPELFIIIKQIQSLTMNADNLTVRTKKVCFQLIINIIIVVGMEKEKSQARNNLE